MHSLGVQPDFLLVLPGCEGMDKPFKLPRLSQGCENPTSTTAGLPRGSHERTAEQGPMQGRNSAVSTRPLPLVRLSAETSVPGGD